MFRMAEDHRADAQGEASGAREGQRGVHLRSGSLQLSEDEKSDGPFSGNCMSLGRSVSALGKSGQNEPPLSALARLRCSAAVVSADFGIMRVTVFAEIGRFSASC